MKKCQDDDLADLEAYDKFDRLLSLIGVLDMMSGAACLDNRTIGELAWTMRERFEDALATLRAERLAEAGVSAKAG